MKAWRRVRAKSLGFAFAHALNGVLGLVYTLAQTLIFARVLSTELFAQTIALAAIGLYLAPLNQAVARANFVLLQARTTDDEALRSPEAAAAFQMSQAIMLILTFVCPLFLSVGSLDHYVALTSLLLFNIYSNIWIFEMQMALMATGHALLFEWLSLARKLLHFGLLAWLWLGGEFLWVSVALAGSTIAFVVYLMIRTQARGIFGLPRGLTVSAARAHLVRFWVSLQATFADWLTFSAPYAVFTAKFGVGPGLIALDTLMKMVRICTTVTRNLCEIILLRVSRAVLQGDAGRARLFVLAALGGGGTAALTFGAIAVYDEHMLFDALLSANNTLPDGSGKPIALAMLAGVAFTVGSFLIGHTGQSAGVKRIMGSVMLSSLALGLGVFVSASVLGGLWLVAAAMAVGGLMSLRELGLLLAARPDPKPSSSPGEALQGRS